MGLCQEFGCQIQDGCDHFMVAGATSCECPECGVVCAGRFSGCQAVWDRGPVEVPFRRSEESLAPPLAVRRESSGAMGVRRVPLGGGAADHGVATGVSGNGHGNGTTAASGTGAGTELVPEAQRDLVAAILESHERSLRDLQHEVSELRHGQNNLSDQIARLADALEHVATAKPKGFLDRLVDPTTRHRSIND